MLKKCIVITMLLLQVSCTRLPVPVDVQDLTPTFEVTVTQTEVVHTATSIPVIPTETLSSTPTQNPIVRFAVIGDYGSGDSNAGDVAALVKNWEPDFIITTGDNNYPSGGAETIDLAVGQFYNEFIFPYIGTYGPGSETNRFFPTLGNHDWMTDNARPYFDYFTLPNNERYYDFTWGAVHFFALDSDSNEPDGVGASSIQGQWLQAQLAASTFPWKIVYMHHPPYSSGYHGPVDWTRWPYKQWGASIVLSGHDHLYERLEVDGLTYIINGIGGGAIYDFINIDPNSKKRFNADYGAILVEADQGVVTFQFITRGGQLIDQYQLNK